MFVAFKVEHRSGSAPVTVYLDFGFTTVQSFAIELSSSLVAWHRRTRFSNQPLADEFNSLLWLSCLAVILMSQVLDEKRECPQSSSPSQLYVNLHGGIDPVAEKRLLRKLDFALLPLFVLLYYTNFVDRTAIGALAVLCDYVQHE